MADVTVGNDAGQPDDYKTSTKTLSGAAPAPQVQGVELVTAVEGGARTDLAKAEDAASAGGEFGLPILGVRNDAGAARTSTDGDFGFLSLDSAGRAQVVIAATAIPAVVCIEKAYTAVATDDAVVSVTSPDRIVLTRISVTMDNANTVDVGFRVGFGATTTPTTAGVVATHPGVSAGGGITIGDGSGVLGIGAAGEDLRVTAEVPTSGSWRINVSYYLAQ